MAEEFVRAADVAAGLAARAEDVCRHYLPGGSRAGNYWQAGDVSGAAGHSLYVHLSGPRVGKWRDTATQDRGDLLDLVRLSRRHATFREAMAEARGFLGGAAPAAVRPEPLRSPAADSARLERFFRSGRAIAADSAAGRYLEGRGLSVEDAGGLRWHPGAWIRIGEETLQLPAVLAPIRARDGRIEAIHRIFITPDGGAAQVRGRKRNSGSPVHGGVWFGDRGARRVAICEGVEDALAALRSLSSAEKRRLAVVASVSAGRLAAVAMPPSVRELVVIQDRDMAGERGWEAVQERYRDSEVAISRILPQGKDVNEDLLERGPEALRETLAPLTERLMRAPSRRTAEGPLDRFFADPGLLQEIEAEIRRLAGNAVAVRFTENPDRDVWGRYAAGVIELALGDQETMHAALSHEVVHALRDLGAISDEEWTTLEAKARRDWLDDPELDIRSRYADRPEREQIEEAIAEAFRRWRSGEVAEVGVARIFERMWRFVRACCNVLRGHGFNTWDDIFASIERGERAAGQAIAAGGARDARRRRQRQIVPARPDLSGKESIRIVERRNLRHEPDWNDGMAVGRWAPRIFGEYRNADKGWNIKLQRHGIDKTVSSGLRYVENIPLLPVLPDLLRTGVHYESIPDTRMRRGLHGFHYFMAAARFGTHIYRVHLTVRETKEGFLFYEHMPMNRKGSDIHGRPSELIGAVHMDSTEPKISIADLFADVKYRDGPGFATGTLVLDAEWARNLPVPRLLRVAPLHDETTAHDGLQPFDQFIDDWRAHVARANSTGRHPFYAAGYEELHARMKELSKRSDLPEEGRRVVSQTLQEHDSLAAGRRRVEDHIHAVDKAHELRSEFRASILDGSGAMKDIPSYSRWRTATERLIKEGKDILDDPRCTLHLRELGGESIRWAVSDLATFHRNDDRSATARAEPARLGVTQLRRPKQHAREVGRSM